MVAALLVVVWPVISGQTTTNDALQRRAPHVNNQGARSVVQSDHNPQTCSSICTINTMFVGHF